MPEKSMKNKRITGKIFFGQHTGAKHYWLAGGGIAAMIIIHFALQFSFIQNENIRLMRDLIKTERVETAENHQQNIPAEEPPAEPETRSDSKPAEDQLPAPEPKRDLRSVNKPDVTKRSAIAAPSRKTVRSTVIRKQPAETRAERLRRAERILTGA